MRKLIILSIFIFSVCQSPSPPEPTPTSPPIATISEPKCKVWSGSVNQSTNGSALKKIGYKYFKSETGTIGKSEDSFFSNHKLDGVTCDNWDESKSEYSE